MLSCGKPNSLKENDCFADAGELKYTNPTAATGEFAEVVWKRANKLLQSSVA